MLSEQSFFLYNPIFTINEEIESINIKTDR